MKQEQNLNQEIADLKENINQLTALVKGIVNKSDDANKDLTYTEKETSEILKLSVRTLITYRQQGLIDFHQMGRRIIYTQKNIDDYLERSKKKAYQYK